MGKVQEDGIAITIKNDEDMSLMKLVKHVLIHENIRTFGELKKFLNTVFGIENSVGITNEYKSRSGSNARVQATNMFHRLTSEDETDISWKKANLLLNQLGYEFDPTINKMGFVKRYEQ